MTSTRAADKLRKAGFESVYGLKGGITAWTQANLPLVTGKKTKKKK
jgi:rhodanese-related sulfurtransferase